MCNGICELRSLSLCSLLQLPATSKYPQTRFILRSPISVREKVSHPFKSIGKIMASYYLIFKVSDRRREGKDSELRSIKHP